MELFIKLMEDQIIIIIIILRVNGKQDHQNFNWTVKLFLC